ncbi:MAG: hypothetical protein A2W81_06390 [Betaproteobacteria bacterium RIFCSPLOWO2_12_61_14]|nr:MAG: hypothetical protein A2W81_06390 [Betaproteobacteria bacterium RIFCSPLOWO2_12_61_14]
MGLLLVVLVFVFPLALPVFTFATLLFVALAAERGAKTFLSRGLKAIALLVLLAGPGTVSNSAGSFLLPWWMHVAVGHSGVRYYVFQYAGLCVVLLFVLLVAVAIWRGPAPQTSLKGHAPFSRRRLPPR